MSRCVIRGFRRAGKRRALVFQEHFEVDETGTPEMLVIRHMGMIARHLAEHPHMIEIEFLDLPVDERFLRFGTDPSLMTLPIELNLEKL